VEESGEREGDPVDDNGGVLLLVVVAVVACSLLRRNPCSSQDIKFTLVDSCTIVDEMTVDILCFD
jgi:hypothetical protein